MKMQALRVKAHPVPPHYESPEPDATVGLGQRGLQCTKVTEASAYRIQVANAAGNFAQPLLDANDLKDCTLPADALAKPPRAITSGALPAFARSAMVNGMPALRRSLRR